MESPWAIPFTSWCLTGHKVHLLRQKRSHQLWSLECDISIHTLRVTGTVWVTDTQTWARRKLQWKTSQSSTNVNVQGFFSPLAVNFRGKPRSSLYEKAVTTHPVCLVSIPEWKHPPTFKRLRFFCKINHFLQLKQLLFAIRNKIRQ